jgi:hypothetical protein
MSKKLTLKRMTGFKIFIILKTNAMNNQDLRKLTLKIKKKFVGCLKNRIIILDNYKTVIMNYKNNIFKRNLIKLLRNLL